LSRIILAFRAFFALLFTGKLPPDLMPAPPRATAPAPKTAQPPKPPEFQPADGALQLLGMLQREGRILDFFMEDIEPYSDEQVGGAAREVQAKTREFLTRHFAPAPVIDAVEGTSVNGAELDAARVKYIGNVPATGKPTGGLLRHRGWRATAISLPQLNTRQDLAVLAPAEIEVE
jgi:hypothetical protein